MLIGSEPAGRLPARRNGAQQELLGRRMEPVAVGLGLGNGMVRVWRFGAHGVYGCVTTFEYADHGPKPAAFCPLILKRYLS